MWRRDQLNKRTARLLDIVPDSHRRKVLGRAIEVLTDPDADIDAERAALDECADDAALDALAA